MTVLCVDMLRRIRPDGEGYIDYVGDALHRRRGVGRDLVIALTRELMTASPKREVALAVDDDRTAARALYVSSSALSRSRRSSPFGVRGDSPRPSRVMLPNASNSHANGRGARLTRRWNATEHRISA